MAGGQQQLHGHAAQIQGHVAGDVGEHVIRDFGEIAFPEGQAQVGIEEAAAAGDVPVDGEDGKLRLTHIGASELACAAAVVHVGVAQDHGQGKRRDGRQAAAEVAHAGAGVQQTGFSPPTTRLAGDVQSVHNASQVLREPGHGEFVQIHWVPPYVVDFILSEAVGNINGNRKCAHTVRFFR